ncbi:TlyA family RNA methyltransferase [Henriciella sp.]|uniref:TlyA family RNA methyltransferase n=1 Tax=Henriciella sp. TaxID=1968823 RepID=UPI002601BA16|nr:TlyA family RNA methyltransferase [Henriciella sp.]
MSETDRADRLLVRLGHFESRAAAQAAIAGGHVRVNGKRLSKPSARLNTTDRIEARLAHPWVSRGGLKLAHALDVFGVDPAGRYCLDIGASTGGFSDVLISRGARHVYAVDVGRGQLHQKVAADARVTSLEATDARKLTPEVISKAPSLIVCDASFIALEKILPVPLDLASPGGELVTLFKPQFQVGRGHVGKGGLVTDRAAAREAEEAFCRWLSFQGWQVNGCDDSPITGGDGNAERLIHATGPGPG